MELRRTKSESSVFLSLDWLTVFLYLILVCAGAVSIYAASYDYDNVSMFAWSEFSGKQITWIGLSLIIGFFILMLDYRAFEAYAYPVYGIVILILLLTIFVAHDINGSRSWIQFGAVSLQPAEFGKFATALALAKLFDSYNFNLNAKLSNYCRALIIIFIPISLILLQKETGSALVYLSLIFVLYREGMSGLVLFSVLCAIAYFVVAVKFTDPLIMGIPVGEFSVLLCITLVYALMLIFFCKDLIVARNNCFWLAGSGLIVFFLSLFDIHINGTYFFIGILTVSFIYTLLVALQNHLKRLMITVSFAAVSILFLFSVNYVFGKVLQPHQQMRIKVVLGIENDPRGVGYNVNQSIIAIGSGGLEGKGFLNGTQTKLKYVPEQHTDFIFCTIGEEQGFIGSSIVLVTFLALILRLIYLAERQKTSFGRVYAYCVVSFLIFHLFVNVGMVIGLIPVIGIPLPFFSYGGSALWGFTFLLFILLRIDAARKEIRD